MRALFTVTFVLALTALTTSCSSGGNVTAHATTAASAAQRVTRSPSCAPRVGNEPSLEDVTTAMVRLPGLPDGVTATDDGRWSFASLQGPEGRIAVSSDGSFTPILIRTIPLPAGGVSGLAVTHDGRLLLAAADRGALVVSVARATQGTEHPVLGALMAPARGASAGGGAGEIAVSPDDYFAFVSLEGAGAIAVFDLRAAAADGFGGGGFIGTIPLGVAPLGVAVSPDGRWLYATSELARGRGGGAHGTLTVIDLHQAETDPANSVVAVAAAPCHPVRVAASPDGRTVWVTARVGNELLGYSVAKLLSNPRQALVAAVRVGEQPIGLAVVDGGRRVIVADSNLLGKPGVTAGLTVVDTAAALDGEPALLGAVRAGKLPSEIAVEPSGKTLLVNNSGSGQLEAVDVAQIP
jgi:DNA-binding beta-propeller fold protein YncE